MIGLVFLIGIALWLIAAIAISAKMPRLLRLTKHHTAAVLLCFPVVLTTPVVDDLIGRWQFYRLCHRDAVVTLSPDWEKVKRAQRSSDPIAEIGGYAIRILVQKDSFVDLDTGKIFMTWTGFHTKGGILLDRMGFGLGQSTSCWPKDWTEVAHKVDIDKLIEQGKKR